MTSLGASQHRALDAILHHLVSRHYRRIAVEPIFVWVVEERGMMSVIVKLEVYGTVIRDEVAGPVSEWVSDAGTMTYPMVWDVVQMVKRLPRPMELTL